MSAPKTPLLTTDCVILDSNWRLLLIRRGHAPFEGKLALPGGFVDLDETVDDACRREVLEETGIKLGRLRLIGVYSRPGRDPRGATCSIAYLARTKNANPKAGDDAAEEKRADGNDQGTGSMGFRRGLRGPVLRRHDYTYPVLVTRRGRKRTVHGPLQWRRSAEPRLPRRGRTIRRRA